MGANVELDVFLKKEGFSLKQIFSLLEMEGLYASIKQMRVFDDWEYTNMTSLDPGSIDIDTSDIFLKKFTLIHFTINNKWRCTLITSLIEDTYMNLSFGLNTNDLMQSGENYINEYIALLYNRVTDIINDNISKGQFKGHFLAASMGVEYSVQFNSDIMTMLNDDNGAARWILSKNLGESIFLKNFGKEEKSATIVFTRL